MQAQLFDPRLPPLAGGQPPRSRPVAEQAQPHTAAVCHHLMLEQARAFLARRPQAMRVVLAAGLSQHHLALGTGPLWINADTREQVLARGRQGGAAHHERRLDVPVDLHARGWWQRLALPAGQREPPLLLWAESWPTRFDAATRMALLQEVGEHAPPGTRLLLDLPARASRSRWAGGAWAGAQACDTGLGTVTELLAAHPRLRIDGIVPVLRARGVWPGLWDLGFRLVNGLPSHAVYVLGVDA